MKKIICLLLFLTFNSYAARLIVKFKEVPENVSHLKGWDKLAPQNYSRLKNVYVYNDLAISNKEAKKWILSHFKTHYIEENIPMNKFSIIPSDLGVFEVNDPLFKFQWGNKDNGQKIFNEIVDIKDILVPSNRTSDIGIHSIFDLDNLIKKEVVVAVLDTGVDYNHPDLKDNIALNIDECENGEIPYEPEVKEGNPYPGDCKGWNFTGRKKGGDNRPEDYVGHGTHISGVISAISNNNIGISGISNKIKILPVKILSSEPESSHLLGTSERLVKALEYAKFRKVDVINLSLGWPLSFDNGLLSDAIKDVLDAGIVVVAAAGNNDHSEPIMPCAYENVICVGSNDPDGKMSDFSNFGAHVDVLAPGNNIMSTFPTAIVPMFSDFNAYEIKSGTSQAAPYVSLFAALVKGIYPEYSNHQIREKILSHSIPHNKGNKFASGDIIKIDETIFKEKHFIRPIFKGFNRVRVNRKDKTFSFELKFEGDMPTPSQLNAKVIALDGVDLESENFKLNSKDLKIIVKGKLSSLNLKLLQKFQLILSYGGQSFQYTFEKRFFLEFDDLENIRRFKITGALPKSLTDFSTIHYYHIDSKYPYYYSLLDSRNGKIMTLFKMQDGEIKRIGITKLDDFAQMVSVHILDANSDGVEDILVRYMSVIKGEGDKENENKIIYAYLKTDLRPLYAKQITNDKGEKRIENYSLLELKLESVILNDLSNFALTKVKYHDFGTILVPVFLNYTAQLPSADLNANPFTRLRNRIFSQRIYYYLPVIEEGKPYFTTRTLNTNSFVDKFKKEIGFAPFQQVFLTKIKKQSFDEIKDGVFSIYFSLESERRSPKNFVLEVKSINDAKWNVKRLKGSQLNYSNYSFYQSYNLMVRVPKMHEYDLQSSAYDKFHSKFSIDNITIKDRENGFVSIVQDDIYNPLEAMIQSYYDDKNIYRFYLTPSKIFLDIKGEDSRKVTYPTHVSSFLPGALFREQHYPIVVKNADRNIPAFYVDSTQIASRNIYLIVYENLNLIAPIRFNINIPNNCKAMNPIVSDLGEYEYVLKCLTGEDNVELIFIPLSRD